MDPLEEETQLANRLLARLEVEKIVVSARRGVEAKSVSRVAAADSLVALNLALSDGLAPASVPPMSPGRSHFYDAQMDALKLKQKELERRLAVTPIETLVTARIDPRVRVQ